MIICWKSRCWFMYLQFSSIWWKCSKDTWFLKIFSAILSRGFEEKLIFFLARFKIDFKFFQFYQCRRLPFNFKFFQKWNLFIISLMEKSLFFYFSWNRIRIGWIFYFFMIIWFDHFWLCLNHRLLQIYSR